ncbi:MULTISPECIES: hypothetical protein [Gammaproteobacteria]|uniref:Uncharacterized protein n=1 Tax=Yersinia aleksiciae TaxID=263819 RepID=A0A0T9V1Y6_YERAE|nr:hypothetical protein [Acinetobacter baumannii]AJK18498.1 hypothetical protein BZ19_4247 [Yersinia pseudotuberculosis str. PA3606]CNL95184.1 Uncharacterised protein [Yersinia aleksiciae]
MSYVANAKVEKNTTSLNREETSSSRKPINKGLMDFIRSSANLNDGFVQRGRILGS